MEALVTETSKWPVSTRKPKAPQLVAVKVLHGKKYKLHHLKTLHFKNRDCLSLVKSKAKLEV